jgi:hypothetical protein
LRSSKPKRGRKRTPESIDKRLAAIDELLTDASPVDELLLVQERRDLEAEREILSGDTDLAALEDDFVNVAATYGERKGIAYASWREVGVPAATLKRAGVSRSQRLALETPD